MGNFLDRYSLALGAAMCLLVGVGLGWGVHEVTHPPRLESVVEHKIALLDLANLKPHVLQRLHLADIKDRGLQVLGFRDLKDPRLKKIPLSEVREEYLERIRLTALRDYALDELTIGDIQNADWANTPYPLPETMIATKDDKQLMAQAPAAVPVLPLHNPNAVRTQPQKRASAGPAPRVASRPKPAARSVPKPAPRVATRSKPAPRIAQKRSAPRRYVAARPPQRQYVITRVYPTPQRRIAVERDIAFAPEKPGKLKKFGRKVKSVFKKFADAF